MTKTNSIKLLLFLIIGLVSTTLKGQSIKDFYIPLNYNKSSFYKPDKSGEKSDFTRIIEYHNNDDGSYSIYSTYLFQDEPTSKTIERIVFTANSVTRTKSIVTSMMGDKEQIYNPSQTILKMPAKDQTVTWTIPGETGQSYIASWTTITIKGETKKAIKVIHIITGLTVKEVSYYVQGIGLMKKDFVYTNGNIKPSEIFDGLSNE